MNGQQDEDIRRLERVIAKVDALDRLVNEDRKDLAEGMAGVRRSLESIQVSQQRQAETIVEIRTEFAYVRWVTIGFVGLVLIALGTALTNFFVRPPTP